MPGEIKLIDYVIKKKSVFFSQKIKSIKIFHFTLKGTFRVCFIEALFY